MTPPTSPPVVICPYQPAWPTEFRAIAALLAAGLGDLALRIDHIGSTAVPGLAAKDIIDVQITVAALDARVIAAMTALGYAWVPENGQDHLPPGESTLAHDWEKLYFRPPAGQRRTHIHVRAQGRANQRYALLFRDYLRTHPDTAAAYAALKRQLAQHLADPATYPEVKDPAVDLIYLAAEAWAAAVGWEPGPPDAGG